MSAERRMLPNCTDVTTLARFALPLFPGNDQIGKAVDVAPLAKEVLRRENAFDAGVSIQAGESPKTRGNLFPKFLRFALFDNPMPLPPGDIEADEAQMIGRQAERARFTPHRARC